MQPEHPRDRPLKQPLATPPAPVLAYHMHRSKHRSIRSIEPDHAHNPEVFHGTTSATAPSAHELVEGTVFKPLRILTRRTACRDRRTCPSPAPRALCGLCPWQHPPAQPAVPVGTHLKTARKTSCTARARTQDQTDGNVKESMHKGLRVSKLVAQLWPTHWVNLWPVVYGLISPQPKSTTPRCTPMYYTCIRMTMAPVKSPEWGVRFKDLVTPEGAT